MTVEIAHGDRPFEITEAGNPNNVQLRTRDALWHKERAINIGIQNLPQDWRYVAWIDADVEFIRHDWPEEICHLLQEYSVIQLFQNAIDLGPKGEVMKVHNGFMWAWKNGLIPQGKATKYSQFHPGYAWAATRKAIDDLGGLIDFAILGAGDAHLSWNLIERQIDYMPQKISDAYRRELLEWQTRCQNHIKKNVGFMTGTLVHHFHGKKKDRKYLERWQILFKHGFDPDVDLKCQWNGLYQFTHEGLRMRNDIRAYFDQRNEDSIDL
jgi:hypothetical protein